MNEWRLKSVKDRDPQHCLFSPRGVFWVSEKNLALALLDMLNKYERMLWNANLQNDESMLRCINQIIKLESI